MTAPDGFVDATGYLTVMATRRTWGPKDPKPVESARLTSLRIGRPGKLDRDQVAVKVTIRLPSAAFDPLAPDALIVVPPDLIQRGPIEVIAIDATETSPA